MKICFSFPFPWDPGIIRYFQVTLYGNLLEHDVSAFPRAISVALIAQGTYYLYILSRTLAISAAARKIFALSIISLSFDNVTLPDRIWPIRMQNRTPVPIRTTKSLWVRAVIMPEMFSWESELNTTTISPMLKRSSPMVSSDRSPLSFTSLSSFLGRDASNACARECRSRTISRKSDLMLLSGRAYSKEGALPFNDRFLPPLPLPLLLPLLLLVLFDAAAAAAAATLGPLRYSRLYAF
mmetsp:Transcript_25618/g.42755  ORF Transcript_25618/g.42755 Transcript_25618/m.42755 type:complete len:238 (+) Transcript_25618:2025-2738(+)